MIYVYPNQPRSKLESFIILPFLFIQILLLHPKLGLGYAYEWTKKSLNNEQLNIGY